ncbi:hypothetical protein ACIA8G_15325 [Lentzea sp. NPDC051213]|uniref:hypothetical protein n=1 Tax=Lentzea sp. NPDC051213 TaxID=3364126 RepID=UPI0037A0B599
MSLDQNMWAPLTPPPSRPRRPLIIGLSLGFVLLLAMAAAGLFFIVPLVAKRIADAAPGPIKGDPDSIVLRQEPGTGPAFKYGGTPIYDACTLVTIASLESFGLKLARDYNVGHEHLDADVPADAAIALGSGPDRISNCFYMLDSKDSLHVDVHQTPFTTPADLTVDQNRAKFGGAEIRTSAGLSLASWRDDRYKSDHVMLWNADLLVEVTIRQTDDSTGALDVAAFVPKLESLLQSGIAAGPTAPMRHVYDSPVETVKDPCAIASAAAFSAAFPSIATAPSIVDGSYPIDATIPESEQGRSNARRADLACSRTNIVPRGSLNTDSYRVLKVDLLVWDRKLPADTRNAAHCDPSTEHTRIPVAPSIGTGQACLVGSSGEWELKFQVDNVNVGVQYGDSDARAESAVRLEQLVPAAKSIDSAGLFR